MTTDTPAFVDMRAMVLEARFRETVENRREYSPNLAVNGLAYSELTGIHAKAFEALAIKDIENAR